MPRSDFKKRLQLLKLNGEHYRHSCCDTNQLTLKKAISAKAPCGNDDSARTPVSIIVSKSYFNPKLHFSSTIRAHDAGGPPEWLAGHKRPKADGGGRQEIGQKWSFRSAAESVRPFSHAQLTGMAFGVPPLYGTTNVDRILRMRPAFSGS